MPTFGSLGDPDQFAGDPVPSWDEVGRGLKGTAQGIVGGLNKASQYLGIPSGNVRSNTTGDVVFPTNAFERGLQSSDEAAGQYAAAFVGPGEAKAPRAFHQDMNAPGRN
jgi:hypothetical protein